MRRLPAIGRILIAILALVLAAVKCPAEGLVFFEQHEPLAASAFPQLRPNETQVVLDLGGRWEAKAGDKAPAISAWLPGGFWGKEGEVQYRRRFTLPDSLRRWNFQLHLPEVHYQVQVWINGRMISSFTGNHLGFSCDVSRDLLKFAEENEIVLRVSNRLSPTSSLPLSPQLLQPRNYGGVFSGVFLRGVPGWSIEDLRLIQRPAKAGENGPTDVVVRIAQYSPGPGANDSSSAGTGAELYVALRDSAGGLIADARRELAGRGAEEEFQITMPLARIAPRLWSPENPSLYDLSAILISSGDTLHRVTRKVGFKQLEIRGGDFYLNGSRLRVHGMDYVPEHPSGSRAMSGSQLERDVKAMKDLGGNVIRVPFGPPPPGLFDLADRLGLLLLVEAGVNDVPSRFTGNSTYRELCAQTYSRLIDLYGGHVSVLGWGIGSQMDFRDPAVQQFGGWLREEIRARDARPCYVESADLAHAGPADFLLAGDPDEALGDSVEMADRRDVPVILSRVGRLVSPADPGQRRLSSGQVDQADFLLRRLAQVNGSEVTDGYIIHSFADYHGASTLFAQPNQFDPYLYGFGIVADNRTERVAYFKLRDLVQTGQTSPPLPTTPSRSTPLAFPVLGLVALLITSIEVRRNNVFRQNLKRVFLHPHGFHMDLRYRRFLHTAQPLLLVLLEAVTLSLVVVSILYALRSNVPFDRYLTHFLPSADTKVQLVNLIWNPMRAMLFFSAVFLGLIVLLTVLIRLLSIPFRERMDTWQAANYVVWSFAALLFLLPAGAILFRLLETPKFMMPALLVVGVGLLWSWQRLLSALRIGLGTSAWRVYLTALIVTGILVLGGAAILNHELGTFAYLDHFHRVLGAH